MAGSAAGRWWESSASLTLAVVLRTSSKALYRPAAPVPATSPGMLQATW
jgi:hypothetical protein